MAAITTSLPETIGEVRNWDYRFCWLRDASMSIETLFQIGHVEAARRFMRFVQSTFVSQHDTYQIMYGIREKEKLTEVILGHLSGYKKLHDPFGSVMMLTTSFKMTRSAI